MQYIHRQGVGLLETSDIFTKKAQETQEREDVH